MNTKFLIALTFLPFAQLINLESTYYQRSSEDLELDEQNDLYKSIRYLKIEAGDLVDGLTVGTGLLDNSYMEYSKSGGGGSIV